MTPPIAFAGLGSGGEFDGECAGNGWRRMAVGGVRRPRSWGVMGPAAGAPVMTRAFSGGPEAIRRIVDAFLWGEEHGLPLVPAGLTRELLALALSEVLHTITDIAGPQTDADSSSVDLWLERHLMAITVSFRGAPLPRWLLTNWDRGQQPEILAPRTEVGWGWLLVREAFDSVWLDWAGSEQILTLEKRI